MNQYCLTKSLNSLIAMALFFVAIPAALAETVECGDLKIIDLWVQGPRDDNFVFENNLVLKLDNECGEKNYVHASLEHPAYNSFLSTALANMANGKRIAIAVNTSNNTIYSNELSYISFASGSSPARLRMALREGNGE